MDERIARAGRCRSRALQALLALLLGLLGAGPALGYHYPWDQGHDTTTATEPPEPGPAQQPACEPSCSINGAKALGSPAYAATGHAYWQAYDLALPGRPFIGIYRVYNSNDPVVGLFGNGWAVDFDMALYPALAGSQVQRIYRAANGKRVVYARQADGSYRAPAGRFESVVESAAGVTMTMQDGRRFDFAQDGRLLQRLDTNGNAVAFGYDAALRLVSLSDGRGRSLALAYNAQGFVSTVTDHGGRVWRYGYDTQGNLTSVTDALGGVTRYTWQGYKAPGDAQTYSQLLTATDASGVVMVAYTYSGNQVSSYTEGANRISYTRNSTNTASGGSVTRRDSMSVTTSFDYGALGLITRSTSGIGATVRFAYDANGRITQTTDALGRHWTRSWDTLGRMVSRSNPLGQTTTLLYAGSDPRPLRITTPAGRVMQMGYDSRGNLSSTTDPAGAVSTMGFDARGDLRSVRNALGQQGSFEYTDTGLPLRMTDALGRQTSFTHDALGRVATVTNAAGGVTRWSYDALDRVTSVVDALGQTSSFAYDAVGRVTRVTDAKGSITRYEYDAYGRRTAEVAPDGRRTTYQWRLDNLLERLTWPDGATISYLYDANKRLTRETAGSEQINFGYNAVGQLLSASGPGGTVSYVYDDAGRVSSETSNGRTHTLTRNADGERIGLAFLGQNQTYTRDSRGRITRITSPAGTFDFGYDALGRRTQAGYPNGSSVAYTFDAAGQLTGLAHAGPFNATYAYVYDAAGRITRKSGEGADWNYTVDAIGRLTRAAQGSTVQSYTLDAVGNIVDGGRVHDANHRLLSDATKDYSWDSRGNLTLERVRTTGARVGYTWNAKNQLLRVEYFANAAATTPSRTLQFSYDPLGRRASKTDNGVLQRYVYDGDDLVGVLDASNAVVATQVFSGAIDEPLAVIGSGTTRLLYSDAQQSVAGVASGASLTHGYRYGPYGETLPGSSADSVPFRYTGREKDSEELYHYRARYYHTQTRQFLSADPIGLLGGMNAYRYAQANPVQWSDPFGLYGFGDFASDASSAASWLYGGAKSAAGGAYTWATAWHFEGRAARNKNLPSYAVASAPGSGWRLAPQSENRFHDNGDDFPELKYVNADGREVIFDGRSHQIVTDPCLIGTYNYIAPGARPQGYTDVFGAANWIVRGAGHWVVDVVPYAYGGNVRGWDDPGSP